MFHRLRTDSYFYFAVILGPISWFSLSFFLNTQPNLQITSFLLLQAFAWPLVEVILFRGYLQHYLVQSLRKNYQLAIVLTSLVFSLCHLSAHSLLWSSSVFLPSLVFGYFYHKYQSIVPAYILHAWYNLGFFLLFN